MPAPLAAALRLPAVPAPLPPTDAVALPLALVLVARVAGSDGALCRDNVEELRVGRPAAGRGVDDRDLARRSIGRVGGRDLSGQGRACAAVKTVDGT